MCRVHQGNLSEPTMLLSFDQNSKNYKKPAYCTKIIGNNRRTCLWWRNHQNCSIVPTFAVPSILQNVLVTAGFVDLQVQANFSFPCFFLCLRKMFQQSHAHIVGRLGPSNNISLQSSIKVRYIYRTRVTVVYNS